MKKIIKEGNKLEKFTLPRDEAIKFMEEKGEPYKVELIQDLPEDAVISFYSQGEFVDLCAGPHLMSTKGIKAFRKSRIPKPNWATRHSAGMNTSPEFRFPLAVCFLDGISGEYTGQLPIQPCKVLTGKGRHIPE